MSIETDFCPETYRYTADLLRRYAGDGGSVVPGGTDAIALFRAVCANNLNIILAALDKASAEGWQLEDIYPRHE